MRTRAQMKSPGINKELIKSLVALTLLAVRAMVEDRVTFQKRYLIMPLPYGME